MWKDKRRQLLVAMSLALIVTAGCSNATGDDKDAPPSIQSSTSAPTETSPPSDSQTASDAASEVVRAYYSMRDELRKNPKLALPRLNTVATSGELAAQRKLFKRERREGIRQTGETRIAELTVQSVDLNNSDLAAGQVPTVLIDVCYDVSDVDLLDANDQSVVSTDRPDTGWIRYSVSNYEWDSDPAGAWRVAASENLRRTPCAVS